jgi:hypothetical protein
VVRHRPRRCRDDRQGFDLQLIQYDERLGARRFTRPAWERDIDEPSSLDSLRLLVNVLGCTFDDLLKA